VTIARKDHRCCFCYKKISKGTDYRRETLRPWDHPDNEGFFEAKGHHRCWEIFDMVRRDFDNLLPDSRGEFREMVHEARAQRKRRTAS
jgi:hypothetical protein